MHHAHIGTTAIYLRTIDIQAEEIPDEVDFLYGDDKTEVRNITGY